MANGLSPETLRTRVHLDLLTRLVATLFARGAHAAGEGVDEFVQGLSELLAEDQKMADGVIGEVTADPALTALYAEEICELFDDVRREFRKAIENVARNDLG